MTGPHVTKSWLNWADVSGTPSTIEGLRALFGKYSRTSFLVACSQLTVHLNYGPGRQNDPD
jgi:hypothetical protein